MKKRIAVLLLTVLPLILLGCLPAFVSLLQDAETEKVVSYRELHSIAPYIGENGSGLSFPQKLALINACEVSAITPALAAMTDQQVRDTATAGLQPFIDAGLIRAFPSREIQIIPFVAISPQDAQRYCLFWDVRIIDVGTDSFGIVSLYIDDETGMILFMDYSDFFSSEDLPSQDEADPLLEQFATIWLKQALLWEHAVLCSPDDLPSQYVYSGQYTIAYKLPEDGLYIFFTRTDYGGFSMHAEKMPP